MPYQKTIKSVYQSGVFKPLIPTGLYNGQFVKIILEYDEQQKLKNEIPCHESPVKKAQRIRTFLKGRNLGDTVKEIRKEREL